MCFVESFGNFVDLFISHVVSDKAVERKFHFAPLAVNEIQPRLRGERKLGGLP